MREGAVRTDWPDSITVGIANGGTANPVVTVIDSYIRVIARDLSEVFVKHGFVLKNPMGGLVAGMKLHEYNELTPAMATVNLSIARAPSGCVGST